GPTCQVEIVCGDGLVAGTEECDDGNTLPGDGCNATCHVEFITEIEPNGTTAEATASTLQITGTTVLQGAITPLADKDLYRVTVTTPQIIHFETFTSFYNCAVGTTID